MKPIQTFTVVPSLPKKLRRLRELAHNLWWCWNHEVIHLFRRMDQVLWEETNHNPVLMLGMIKQERLHELTEDEGFLAQLERTYEHFTRYMTEPSWFQKTYWASAGDDTKVFDCEHATTNHEGANIHACIAYFSMEYPTGYSLRVSRRVSMLPTSRHGRTR